MFYHYRLKYLIVFSCLADLVLKADILFDKVCKQNELETISGEINPVLDEYHEISLGWKPLYVFALNVYYRQNNSWQGTINYARNKDILYFKSVLDLMKQLTNIMGISQNDSYIEKSMIINE